MNGWAIFYGLLALIWGLDAFRMRKRASSLSVLTDSDEPVSAGHRFITRDGVQLDDATRRAASAFARREGLLVLDIVPRDLPARRALLFLQLIDVATYRKDPTAPGRSAGEALLVDADVWARAKVGDEPIDDVLALTELARRLKLYASRECDVAVAPRLRTAPEIAPRRRELLRFGIGNFGPPLVVLQSALALTAPIVSPIAGGIALGVAHVQALVATVGTKLSPRGIFLYALFRTLGDLVGTLDVFAPPARDPMRAEASRLRPVYAALLARGTDHFFEPRREECPMCDGKNLEHKLTVGDRLQLKPGRFTLERCKDCRHIFQNPRLSIEGLDFYYKDFYDGLGESEVESLFLKEIGEYRDRARMVRAVVEPSRWLDVGGGHGHFCMVAREEWPEAVFDAVDLSTNIEDAERRRWVAHGYRALFPDLAADLAGKYDVVSMSHYLEHTRDPRAEIQAAAKVVRTGGALLVELPDPESRLGAVIGGFWVPWFQPQHQHFLHIASLEKLLRENGFEPVVVHRGEAHRGVDFVLAFAMLMNVVAPPQGRPWLKPAFAFAGLRNFVLWVLAIPALVVARLVDLALTPLCRRPGWANAYRVVARRL